jgi:hypothetical protein
VLDSLRPRPGRRSGASLPASGAETLGRARLRRALGKRPTEEDFRQLAAAAAQGLARQPGQAQFEALAAWASGGLAYLAGRDAESRQALARSLAHGDLPAALELGPLVPQRRSAGGEIADWELALAYGDARGEAGALIETALARHPGEASLLLGRALVRHLDGRHLEAASEVAALLERPETVVQRARLTLLLAEEHGHAGRWDEARRLLADACSQGSRLACQERDRLAGRAPR